MSSCVNDFGRRLHACGVLDPQTFAEVDKSLVKGIDSHIGSDSPKIKSSGWCSEITSALVVELALRLSYYGRLQAVPAVIKRAGDLRGFRFEGSFRT